MGDSAPDLFDDPFFMECLSLARLSKGQSERYGSVLVREGEVVGRGFNRAIAHSSFGRLERILRMGYANHAEVEAMDDCLRTFGLSTLEGCDLYVAGYFPKPMGGFERPGRLFLKREAVFTCTRCIPFFERYGIGGIHVPTAGGWARLSVAEAKESALDYLGGTHEKRCCAQDGDYTLDDVALIPPELLGIAYSS